jgi:cation diffusion facilitator family transporter
MSIDVALVAIKLGVGLSIGSLGLVSDAVHSLTDALAGGMAWVALRTAARPPDREHPFGHGRAENLAAYTQGIVILLAAGGITWEAITRLGHPSSIVASYPVIGLLVGLLALELGRTLVLSYFGKTKRSPALLATGIDKRADLLGVSAVLLGLIGVREGLVWADTAAALVVATLIATAAVRLMLHAGDTLIDRAPSEEVERVRTVIASVEGVMAVGDVRLRQSGGETIGEARVSSRRTLSVEGAEALKEKIAQVVAHKLDGVKLTLIVDPYIDAQHLVERIHAVAGKLEVFKDIHNVTVEAEEGGGTHISLHAKLPAAMKLAEAHAEAERLKKLLRAEMGQARVDVHLEPLEPDLVIGTDVTSARKELVTAIRALVAARPGVLSCQDVELSQRAGGTVAYVAIELDSELSLEQAHAVESEVEKSVSLALPELGAVVAEAVVDLKLASGLAQ